MGFFLFLFLFFLITHTGYNTFTAAYTIYKTSTYTYSRYSIYNIYHSIWLIICYLQYEGLHYFYYLQCYIYTTSSTIRLRH